MPRLRESLDTRRADDPGRTLLRLLSELRGKRREVLRLFPAHLVATAAALAWPRVLGLATDAVASRGEAPVPWGRVAALLLGGLAATGLGCLASRATGRGTARLSAFATSRLRRTLFAAVLGLPMARLGETRRGELLARLAGDASAAGETLGQGVLQFVASCTTLALTLAYMLFLSVPLSIVACSVLPVSFLAGRALARVSRRLFRARQAALGALNAIAEEGVGARREIRAFGLEEARDDLFSRASSSLRSLAFRAEGVGGCTGPLMNAIGNVSYLLVAAFGGWWVLCGRATPGLVITFLLYARQFGRPVNELAAQFGQLQSAVAGAERVFRLVDEPSEDRGGDAPFDPASARGEIRFEDVRFRYGDGPLVIPGFSLVVPAGATVALVGETGSGKTTLAGMIPRFHDPESGRVLLDGADLRSLPLEGLRRAVAVVPQDVRLFSGTVADNVAAGRPGATEAQIAAALSLSGADSFVRRLPDGAATQVGVGGASLSHGQRQLLAIARAALADPRVLVLDEATSAVDPLTEKRIRDAIARLFRGRTCIVVAHRLSTVRGADKIVVLDGGRAVGEGPHDDLLRSCPKYRALWSAASRLVPVALAALLCLPSAAALPSDAEIAPLFNVVAGPLPRTSRDLPWRVENAGADAVEHLVVRAVAQWGGGVSGGAEAPAPEARVAYLAAGSSTSGVFRLPEPPLPGPHGVAVCAEGRVPDGRTMRSWAQSRVWGAASREGRAPERPFEVAMESVGGTGAVLRVRSLVDSPLPLRCGAFLCSGFSMDGAPSAFFDAELPARGLFETNLPVARVSPFALAGAARASVSAAPGGAFVWTENVRAALAAPRDASAFPRSPPRLPLVVPLALFGVLSLFSALRRRAAAPLPATAAPLAGFAVAVAASLYLAFLMRLDMAALSGCTAVAGDLAAHHVLVDRIARTGRVFGRCAAWWGSFPAFRFYFPLPYVLAAALSHVVGHSAAFNLTVALPVVLLPVLSWLGARVARLPSPCPAFFAAATLPLALDNGNTMWGGNAYSALSGMFASAWGFALLPVALGLGVRDAARGRLSATAPAVMAALALCHFFSALMCAAGLGALAFGLAVSGRRRAFAALAADGLVAAALCSFWLVPLAAARGWSVDFGTQWLVAPLKQLSPALSPLAAFAALLAFGASFLLSPRSCGGGAGEGVVMFSSAFAAMGVAAAVLFFFGRSVSDVFVNCRLWPFGEFAALALVSLAWARLASALRAPRAGAVVFLSLCAALAWRVGGNPANPRSARECLVPAWAESSWGGFERLPDAPKLRRIVELVRSRAGAVAWDRHLGNAALGSVRVFEALPFLAPGTRTVEGGLVNGALGAIAAHAVQFEMSDEPGGWPLLVKRRPFAPEVALRHLEELGVRTVIARSPRFRAALEKDSGWRLLEAVEPWGVYASRLDDPGLVRVVRDVPAPPINPGESPQRVVAAWWNARPAKCDGVDGFWLRDASLDIDSGEVRFRTDHPGQWHVLSISAGPDWTATGTLEGPVPLASGQVAVRPDSSGTVVLRAAAPFPLTTL